MFPKSLGASKLSWLQREGFNLVKILEIVFLESEQGTTPFFHHVLFSGSTEVACFQDKDGGWADTSYQLKTGLTHMPGWVLSSFFKPAHSAVRNTCSQPTRPRAHQGDCHLTNASGGTKPSSS